MWKSSLHWFSFTDMGINKMLAFYCLFTHSPDTHAHSFGEQFLTASRWNFTIYSACNKLLNSYVLTLSVVRCRAALARRGLTAVTARIGVDENRICMSQRTLVLMSSSLSYCCLSISSNQSVLHFPLPDTGLAD